MVRVFVSRFAGPLTVLLGVVAAVVSGVRVTFADLGQMFPAVERFMAGDWGGVFPVETGATSMIVWLVLAGVPFVVARLFVSNEVAWVVAGSLASWPILIAGMRFGLRRLYPSMSVERAWGLTALALVMPTTFACWFNYYHPQDLTAVGLVFFAFGLAAGRRWGWAGVLFGLAVLTRQWALLIALAVVPLSGTFRSVVKFGAAGTAVTLAGLLPFVLTGNEGLWTALSASLTVGSYETIMGSLLREQGDGSVVAVLVRLLPAVATVVMATFVWLKGWRGVHLFLPLASSVIAFRLLFESAPYLYYWAPLPIFLLGVSGARRWGSVVGAVGLSFAAWLIPTALYASEADFAIFAGVGLTLSLAALLVAWASATGGVQAVEKGSFVDEPASDSVGNDVGLRAPLWGWVVSGVAGATLFVFVAPMFNPPLTIDDSPPVIEGFTELTVADVFVEGEALVPWSAAGSIVGKVAPRFTGTELGGGPVSFGGEGKATVVAFLPHWHPDSQHFVESYINWEKDPSIVLGDVFGDVFFLVVLVEDDYLRGNWPASLWLESQGWEVPSMMDSESGTIYQTMGSPPLPFFFVLNSEGVIVSEHIGKISLDEFKSLFKNAQ